MTTRQPGVDVVPDVLWSSALARGLLRDDMLRTMRYRDGYTDLLGPIPESRRSLSQRAMDSRLVAAIYERFWRPVMVIAMSLHGISIDRERERACTALHLDGQQRVLDVACGPGNFTSFFADRLAGDGFVIGLDNSVPMMERAARDNSHPRAVYMRADAMHLPFNDRAFDAVCCFAALHLVSEPMAMLHEMLRVLTPGGRIAVMTTYGRESFAVRKGLALGATVCGVRVFDRTTLTSFLSAAGLVEIDQQLRGIAQFVTARRGEYETELDRLRIS
jgi:ubiquinone/menaquinone biosynthesis C-methylase UbiE